VLTCTQENSLKGVNAAIKRKLSKWKGSLWFWDNQ